LPACLQCTTDFPAPAARRGKVQTYCSRPCQTKAANARRATTRKGRVDGITYPHTSEAPGRPLPSTPSDAPANPQTTTSDSPSVVSDVDRSADVARLAFLMDKAHSRVGVTAWELAEIARARGISAWAPLCVILAKGTA
jgi:hypothetical protein